MTTAVEAFAGFARETGWDDIPRTIQDEARRAVLNFVGCAIGGVEEVATVRALKGCQALAASQGIPLLGRAETLDMQGAALVNCVSSAALTFDDTHLPTITHPTGPVAAALLAYAHGRNISWRDFLTALVLGIEVECRLARALAGEDVKASRSWYVTGLTGGAGAAAALGKVMGLNHEQLCSAIGLGAMQGSGTRATHASDAIALVPGLAARNGVAAALLAEAGMVCNVNAIDGRHGLLEAIAPESNPAGLVDGLGQVFELSAVSYKPYPCGIVIHPTIDACLALRQGGRIDADAVARVEIEVQADTLTLCWRKLPSTELEAQVSLYHWAAVALHYGAAGVEQGRLGVVQDPEVRRLQDLMEARVDPSLARDQAHVKIIFKDGAVRSAITEHAVGSIARPMTQAQLDQKFTALCAPRLGASKTKSLLAMCCDPDLDRSVSDLFKVAGGA